MFLKKKYRGMSRAFGRSRMVGYFFNRLKCRVEVPRFGLLPDACPRLRLDPVQSPVNTNGLPGLERSRVRAADGISAEEYCTLRPYLIRIFLPRIPEGQRVSEKCVFEPPRAVGASVYPQVKTISEIVQRVRDRVAEIKPGGNT